MSNVDVQRIFEIDSSSILFPHDCWRFDRDGNMISEDKDRFLKEFVKWGEAEAHKVIENYEKIAAKEIAEILKSEAEWKTETEEEQKARLVDEKKKATEKYLSEVADIKEALHNRMNN